MCFQPRDCDKGDRCHPLSPEMTSYQTSSLQVGLRAPPLLALRTGTVMGEQATGWEPQVSLAAESQREHRQQALPQGWHSAHKHGSSGEVQKSVQPLGTWTTALGHPEQRSQRSWAQIPSHRSCESQRELV